MEIHSKYIQGLSSFERNIYTQELLIHQQRLRMRNRMSGKIASLLAYFYIVLPIIHEEIEEDDVESEKTSDPSKLLENSLISTSEIPPILPEEEYGFSKPTAENPRDVVTRIFDLDACKRYSRIEDIVPCKTQIACDDKLQDPQPDSVEIKNLQYAEDSDLDSDLDDVDYGNITITIQNNPILTSQCNTFVPRPSSPPGYFVCFEI